jgi:hypothetical protein
MRERAVVDTILICSLMLSRGWQRHAWAGVSERVDALGGKLTLRRPLGEGTSLVIELPLEPAEELNGCGCAHLHLCRWLGISTREVLD